MSYRSSLHFVPFCWFLSELWPLNFEKFTEIKFSTLFFLNACRYWADFWVYLDELQFKFTLVLGMWVYLDEIQIKFTLIFGMWVYLDELQIRFTLIFSMWVYLDELQIKFTLNFVYVRLPWWVTDQVYIDFCVCESTLMSYRSSPHFILIFK